MYRCVYLHICYSNRVNIHNYYNCSILYYFLSLTSDLLLTLFHLSLFASKQDRASQRPTIAQPLHSSQKSHLSQTPKPKLNYTHNSKTPTTKQNHQVPKSQTKYIVPMVFSMVVKAM